MLPCFHEVLPKSAVPEQTLKMMKLCDSDSRNNSAGLRRRQILIPILLKSLYLQNVKCLLALQSMAQKCGMYQQNVAFLAAMILLQAHSMNTKSRHGRPDRCPLLLYLHGLCHGR